MTGVQTCALPISQTDRRGVSREFDEAVEQLLVDRIRPEAPHVTPPQDEVAKRSAERRVERQMDRRHWLDSRHGQPVVMAWKKVPLTEPRQAPASATGLPATSQQSTSAWSPIETMVA